MDGRSVVYRLIADVSGVLAGTRQASASMRKLGDDITGAGKNSERMRKGLDEVGRTAGRVGLIAAAGLGVMIAKAAGFEQAMSNVAAATHETEANMRLLRAAAIDAGARTQFSATEAAGAIEQLAKAGVATADILGKNGALNGALDLAAAGQIAVGDAAEFTATALTQFQLAGSEATHVADLLAAGAGKAQGEVADIALALGYAGVPAANLGVSIEETAGALALFASNGIIGERAGTSLRGMLSSLTSPSKLAKKTMDDLGISMFDQKGKFIGLAGVAEQLQARMKGLTDEERANYLGRIFGNEQLQAANVLYRQGAAGIQTWERNVNDAGFAAETAAIKTDNLRGDLERLGGAIDTALIKGGQGSQGFLRGLTQGATSAVDAFNKLPDSFAGTISGMLAITAITGGGLWFGTKVIRGIADTREALANLGDAGIKASKGLKVAAAAGAGFTAALVAVEVIKAIQTATDDALPGLNTMQKRLLEIAETGSAVALGEQFDDVASSIDRIGESQKGLMDGLRANPRGVGDSILGAIGLEGQHLHEAKREIDAIDRGLAGLVASRGPDVAAEALTAFAQANQLSAEQMAILRANLPAYDDALDGLEVSTEGAADAHEGMGKKVVIAGKAIKFTEEQIEEARKAYQDARETAGEVASAFLDISENADKAKVSLGAWIRQMEKQTQALLNFTENVQKAAGRGVADGLLDQLAELGPAGALRVRQLANATDEEIDRANRAWRRGQKAIEAYVDATTEIPDELRTDVKVIDDPARRAARRLKQQFMEMPKSTMTELRVDTKSADAGIRAVEARLAKLQRERIIKVRIEHTDVRLGDRVNRASGGVVYGPGTATSDSIPAYLSNGEYVIKAAAVARYGVAMFDRLNAMRFAQGGYVGGGTASIAPADVSALLGGMANLRPLANHVEIKTPNHKGFIREESRIRRAAATDGMPQR